MFKIGIIGAGWIARKMAETIAELDGYSVSAIASRDIVKAKAFAKDFAIKKAYGSYEELVVDPVVDLVYVATPHSHHLCHASLAIEQGKPVLVEKAFTANEKEARQLVDLARRKGVFLAEAIWTRYMPMSFKIRELMDSGVIGKPVVLTATLCYPLQDKERVMRPELCGGALLDVGVYVLNFAKMYFGGEVEKTITNCRMGETGVDLHELISLSYKDGRMANLQAGALCLNDRQGIISGTEGYIRVDNVNCPERIEVYRNYELVDVFEKPDDMISGYEYQVIEARRCIEAGLLESPLMTHDETIYMMKWMDDLRKSWGVVYPMD